MARWFAYIGRKLHGPLEAREMLRLEGFRPDTEVTLADGEEFWTAASDHPEFARLFAPAGPSCAEKEPPVRSGAAKELECPGCGGRVPLEAGEKRTFCPFCDAPLTLSKIPERGTGALVAVLCPACGGTVRYPEDSRTARCAYCSAPLFVTGRGRSLRYYVAPRKRPADGTEALELVFVPYWRYRATVYFWNIGREVTDERPSWLDAQAESEAAAAGVPLSPSSFQVSERKREFRSRKLDRSVRASGEALGYSSVGGRVSRFSLRPYDIEAMRALGRVLPAVLTREEADRWFRERAFGGLRDESLRLEAEHGTMTGGTMSQVFVPFWVRRGPGDETVFDGVDARPLKSAPREPSLQGREPDDDAAAPPRAVPAECARCGAELAVEDFQALFFCRDCQLCWRMGPEQLLEQAFRVVEAAKPLPAGERSHLPVWRLRVSIGPESGAVEDQRSLRRLVPDIDYIHPGADQEKPVYVYVPAWGNMVTPRMSRVARRFTRKQPEIDPSEAAFDEVARAVFGPEEARTLAESVLMGVIHLGTAQMRTLEEGGVRVLETELILVPAARCGRELIEGVLGQAIGENELREPGS